MDFVPQQQNYKITTGAYVHGRGKRGENSYEFKSILFFPNLGILFIKINSSLIPIAQLSSYWIDSIPNIEKQVWQRLIRALYTRVIQR